MTFRILTAPTSNPTQTVHRTPAPPPQQRIDTGVRLISSRWCATKRTILSPRDERTTQRIPTVLAKRPARNQGPRSRVISDRICSTRPVPPPSRFTPPPAPPVRNGSDAEEARISSATTRRIHIIGDRIGLNWDSPMFSPDSPALGYS